MSNSNKIRAIIIDPAVPERLVIREVEPPVALPNEVIVKVAAFSLNRGEVRRSLTAEAGWRPGWDFAGTIETEAKDGSGLPVGTRVVGFLPAGAWAEKVAVPTHALAPLPDAVEFKVAATLPVAGLTALLSLERGGLLLDRSVLITGASGGVGYFASQLAAEAGAIVTAQVRHPELVEFVKAAKADRVIVGDQFDQYAPYDLVLDSVGGEVLPKALEQLSSDGTYVLFGATAGANITFNASRFYGKGGLSLYGFILFHELKKQPAAVGLARLVKLVANGSLVPHIDVEAPWSEVAQVSHQLNDRQFLGKAVLHIEP
ncbi:Zn-dependent oxidoreductase, NADPH:quinone reductase [Synechococcus sp. PCC 7502]|uniref:zinc-binding dehydrogenase n=1 Tax=Synechococcus sp. PCC 7502 TaxID=1173263 RepID=UPI00029FD2D6|nr:zinc-binding dehydrogenase [Synechococcus sp. PCC 7502]AFY72585.1 Zn-dependent oxidoreductase, NADPH:quinone reductase [Synechococcus sp. PCC 7502]